MADTVAQHPGIVWTNVLSLRREDASRLGYEKAESWIRLLRKQAPAMAKAMKIPLQDLRWYAAFHNEGNHPHCHIVANTTGKKVYGYLPQNTRNLVNGIVDKLAKDPKIAALYDLWYEQQRQIVQFYQDTDPEKLPLSQNKVFKPIRNAVVQETLPLTMKL